MIRICCGDVFCIFCGVSSGAIVKVVCAVGVKKKLQNSSTPSFWNEIAFERCVLPPVRRGIHKMARFGRMR